MTSMKYPWQNVLYIDPQGKIIPYQLPEQDANKRVNFVDLKQPSAELASIPEARLDVALSAALGAINASHTGVFSVGCHREELHDASGHRISGYIEFSVNDRVLVCDAATYFSLFFQFQNRLVQSAFPHSVRFDWAIMPAVFSAVGVEGYSCSIKINSSICSTQKQCLQMWSNSLSMISTFLADISLDDDRAIY